MSYLGKTFLKPGNIYFSNYISYRSDRPTAPGGGTVILIRSEIKHHQPGPLTNAQYCGDLSGLDSGH